MSGINFNKHGQWELLEKAEDPKPKPHIPSGVHEVEVHPHLEHMYNIKGAIKESGKGHMNVGELKKLGYTKQFLQTVPNDGQGRITLDHVDQGISDLPKHKVQVHVGPYDMHAQQHNHNDQHVVSVNFHPNSLNDMTDEGRKHWEGIKRSQHKLVSGAENQIGWARVDGTTKPGHWHIDEIQSDFQNHDKIRDAEWRTQTDKSTSTYKDHLLQGMSHGHEDPQHLIQSVVHQLARKHGVTSTSMDTPGDQIDQSGLIVNDPQLNDIVDNVGKSPELKKLFGDMYNDEADVEGFVNNMGEKHDMTARQKQNLTSRLQHANANMEYFRMTNESGETKGDIDTAVDNAHRNFNYIPGRGRGTPVHQQLTYDKRPKALGYKRQDKKATLGDHQAYADQAIQYKKLHKKLTQILELLKKVD